MDEGQLKKLISIAEESFREGPILPDSITQEEYDKVVDYLIVCGFLQSNIEGIVDYITKKSK